MNKFIPTCKVWGYGALTDQPEIPTNVKSIMLSGHHCPDSGLTQAMLWSLRASEEILGVIGWSKPACEITTTDSVALTDLLPSDGHEPPTAGLTARQVRLAGEAYMLPSVTGRQLASLTSLRPREAQLGSPQLGSPLQSVTQTPAALERGEGTATC